MTCRLLGRFLRDRLWLVATFFVNTAVLLLLVWLLLPVGTPVAAYTGYAFLLTTTVLALYLGVDLIRWWPFARRVEELLSADFPPDVMSNLPEGGSSDQAAFRELAAKLHRRFGAERDRYQEAHQRHLAFINLWVHQMKTPVAAISLIAQQAAEAERHEPMQHVVEETDKLADGLELVLNMARLQDFAVDYQIRRVDLLGAVRAVINRRKKQFIRLGIFPEVDAPDEDWRVLTDGKWNEFILEQIIANALKYGAQGGPPGQRVKVRLERRPRAVVLTIADQGPGIPAADLPRVFEPFFTGENGRRFAGATGIGLWLVRQVAQRLGHEVAIASEQGRGTTVTVTYLANS